MSSAAERPLISSERFYYGDRPIDKDLIAAVRVLINGAPIAAYVSRRAAPTLSRAVSSMSSTTSTT